MWIFINDYLWIFVFCSNFWIGATKTGNQYSISFLADCAQPVLMTCPQARQLSNGLRNRQNDFIQRFEITRLTNGHMVGNLTLAATDTTTGGNDYIYVRLGLSVEHNTTDVKCINMSHIMRESHAVTYCIEMIPENSAVLTMQVISGCETGCRLPNQLVSSRSVPIGERSCLLWRMEMVEDVTITLVVWELSSDLLKFQLSSTVSNLYARTKLFIHVDDVFVPAPIIQSPVNPDRKGNIWFSMPGKTTGHKQFYAKLCLWCSTDDLKCYMTENVQSVPIATGLLPSTDNTTETESALEDVQQSQTPIDPYLLFGILLGALFFICLTTILLWIRFNKSRNRRQKYSRQVTVDSNTVTLSEQPFMSWKETEMNNVCTFKCLSDDLTIQQVEISKENSMILYHPDSQSHEQNVRYLVKHLRGEGIAILGLPEDHFENWRDFAESAGEKFKNIIIVFSQGLHQLFTTYLSEGSIGGSSEEESWEKLLIQRNQEYIPCVVLTKLKYLCQERKNCFCIHFVLFTESDKSKCTDLLSNSFSFLHGSNYKMYTLSCSESDLYSQGMDKSHIKENSVMMELINNLKG